MNEQHFVALVKKRAHQNVQESIKAFQIDIAAAFKRLTGSIYVCKDGSSFSRIANYDILAKMIKTESLQFDKEWPSLLWEEEEKQVMTGILSTMDTMQKALVASEPTENDCMPEGGYPVPKKFGI